MRMILQFHYYGTLQLTLNRRTAALLSFGVRGVRRANTRPKASISSQSDDGRGGPVAAFSHLVSLCARKTAPSTTNAAVQVLCLFGREDADGRTGEGRDEGKRHEERK
ncbi:hypothetical protein VZT92_020864 [Zoarces viviparus]|uniref:Uncharacterized protein n=1 Tax=Zoarces viviparus TaxID=48416 RepID=A0AAW1EH99_ZOAVI